MKLHLVRSIRGLLYFLVIPILTFSMVHDITSKES